MYSMKNMHNDSCFNVLIVDDENDLLEVAKELLQKEEINVFTAQSFSEGESILAQHRVHLIICDYHFPGANGEDWLAVLRRRGEEALFVIYTGSFDIEEKNYPAIEGVLKTLIKTDIRGLLETVRTAQLYWAKAS